jgi:hypothetical protein
MLTNETRRQLLNRAKAAQFPGSILEVYRAAEQGIDILADHEAQMQQQMQVAQTPQEQQTGLREEHARGNTQASMAFPNVQPGQSFNTVGMKAPINVDKYDNQGHLVESYKNVPPGIQNLPTGPYEGTIIETPAEYQEGGERFVTVTNEPTYEQKIKDTTSKLKNLEKKVNKSLGDPMSDSFNYSAIPNYDVVAPRYEDLDDKISQKRYDIRMEMFDTRDQEDFDTRFEEALKNNPELTKLLAEQKKLKAEYPTITQMTGDGQIRDALRHTAAGYKTSKAIENKVKNVPYIGGFLDKIGADKLAGFVGSNVLGAGHEAIGYLTSKDWRDSETIAKEAYEDMYNNFMGTKVALFGNKSPNSTMREILSLQKQGKLKKGRVEDKQKGGVKKKKKEIKEIKDNIGFDEQYNIFYDKDIQRSYEQRRGRFAPKRQNKNKKEPDVRLVQKGGYKYSNGGTLGFLSSSPLKKLKAASEYAAKTVTAPFRKKIADNLYPLSYKDGVSRVINAVRGKKDTRDKRTGTKEDYKWLQERTDLLQLHMGQDQKYNSIPKSEYKPTQSKDDDVTYYTSPSTEEIIRNNVHLLSKDNLYTNEDSKKMGTKMGGVLGKYTLSKGEDEKGKYVSYYDKWDFNPFDYIPSGNLGKVYEKTLGFFGMDAPEVYGRVYYQKGGLRNHMMQYLHNTGRDTTYVNTVMNAIGQHESKNNPNQVQVSGNKTDGFYDGPGRGTYQFEVGPGGGGNTAINRTANFLKHNTDKTIHDFPNINTIYNASNSLDFTNLNKKDQDALFIGDKIFGGVERRNEFDALTRNRNTPPTQEETFNYWLNNHKGKVNGKNISQLTQKEIDAERKKWNARTKKVFNKKRGGYKPRFL